MIMMMGISGSGKSTLAKHIYIENDNIVVHEEANESDIPKVHSSDDLRKELYGDATNQEHNNELFVELHRRIKDDLRNGKHVIYDATNINKKLRVSFLNELKNIACKKVCIAVMTPYKVCIENNQARERKVPEKVIRKMYKNWQPPHFHEGFDEIHFAFLCNSSNRIAMRSFNELVKAMDEFDQENEHHTQTLGAHCRMASERCHSVFPANRNLYTAAFLHDIGKLETKVRINSRGIDDGNCHYYQHHCVGAYMAAFYLLDGSYSIEDQVDILNMIYYHMHPYCSWKQSEKAMNKDKLLIGEELFNSIMALHDADVSAH